MRYIRQQIFSEIGKKGQEKLRQSTVAIVGLGALGSVSAQLLTRAGIGRLILIDRDIVELSNLQRQSLFNESDLGKAKAAQAKEHLNKINSDVKIDFFIDDLNYNNIDKIISIENPNNEKTLKSNKKIKIKKNYADLILDCTDNLETRFLINDFSVKNDAPFIYSSAVGSKGYVFDVVPNKTPCLRCFLKEATQLDTCETVGVLNTITNLIPSIQANEALKILLNKNNVEKNLLFFDVWENELSKIKVNKNKNCICCVKNNFEYLSGKKSSRITKLCGDDMYQIKTKIIDKKQFNELKNKLKEIGKIVDFAYCIKFDGKITIFQDGRALIKAKDENEAKSLYSKFVGN
ncbi:ThiF family adenylyltransferase [Candidatus Woesearchaeota archaeon]|nr:ThiF family adenylyltransferase [Candidatus Woesearchaeota archaeon]